MGVRGESCAKNQSLNARLIYKKSIEMKKQSFLVNNKSPHAQLIISCVISKEKEFKIFLSNIELISLLFIVEIQKLPNKWS